MLADREAFPDIYDVVDEIIDFFTAASATTQSGTITILSHFIKDKKSLQRARAEFDSFYAQKLKEDPSLGELSREDLLRKLITANTYDYFEYIGMVVNEGLRFTSPASTASEYIVTQDCTAGKYKFRKGV